MEQRLHRLKERFAATSDMESRMENLELSFQRIQAETKMKLSIIYEILALNCDRMSKSKSELQRQHDSETLLESWKNVEDLAANGLSLRILYDINDDMELLEIPDSYGKDAGEESVSSNTRVSPGHKRRRISTKEVSSSAAASSDEADSDSAWNPDDDDSFDKSRSRSKASKLVTDRAGSGKRRKRKEQQTEESHDSNKSTSWTKDDTPKLVKSEVLNYFEIKQIEGVPRPRGICKLCKKAVSSEIQRLRNHVGKCRGRHNTLPTKSDPTEQDVKPLTGGLEDEHGDHVLTIPGDCINHKTESEAFLSDNH